MSQFGLLKKSRRFEWRLLALKVHSTAHVSQVLGCLWRGVAHANAHRMVNILGAREGERVHAPVLRHDGSSHAAKIESRGENARRVFKVKIELG